MSSSWLPPGPRSGSALGRSSARIISCGSSRGIPLPGPTDSWVTLGALARETSTIRLGTLVTSATFRLPGPLAIAVAQVDAMSGGRVELGLGSGWFEQEHSAYGIPFWSASERFDRLEEQFAILTGGASRPGQRRAIEKPVVRALM